MWYRKLGEVTTRWCTVSCVRYTSWCGTILVVIIRCCTVFILMYSLLDVIQETGWDSVYKVLGTVHWAGCGTVHQVYMVVYYAGYSYVVGTSQSVRCGRVWCLQHNVITMVQCSGFYSVHSGYYLWLLFVYYQYQYQFINIMAREFYACVAPLPYLLTLYMYHVVITDSSHKW